MIRWQAWSFVGTGEVGVVAELFGGYIEPREGDVAVHPVAVEINAGKGAFATLSISALMMVVGT